MNYDVIIIGAGIFKTNDHDIATGSFLIGSNEDKKIELGTFGQINPVLAKQLNLPFNQSQSNQSQINLQ